MSPFERIQALESRVTALESNPVKEPRFQDTNPQDNPNAGKSTGPWMPPAPVRELKAPGFLAFVAPNPPCVWIKVSDGLVLPSLESWFQLTVQQMAGGPGELNEQGVSSLLWTDDQARIKLQNVSVDRGSYLGSLDPNTDPARAAALIEVYVKAFRVAVTPA